MMVLCIHPVPPSIRILLQSARSTSRRRQRGNHLEDEHPSSWAHKQRRMCTSPSIQPVNPGENVVSTLHLYGDWIPPTILGSLTFILPQLQHQARPLCHLANHGIPAAVRSSMIELSYPPCAQYSLVPDKRDIESSHRQLEMMHAQNFWTSESRHLASECVFCDPFPRADCVVLYET